MIIEALKKGQLYVNYLGPSSALLGNLVAIPILISNLGLREWSLFTLINVLLPLVHLILFGNGELVNRLMINIFLGNEKNSKSIDIFYKYEKKIFTRFILSLIFLCIALIVFNSNNFTSFDMIELSFLFVSIAVMIKLFEYYYTDLLNGLKQHYKLQLYAFVVTISKWSTIIYLSFLDNININTLLLAVIIFSIILITIQRIIILNIFKKNKKILTEQNKDFFSDSAEKNFGVVMILILILQQLHNVLVFGILDPISLSYFGIAFMLSATIPLIISPVILYLTPEIYETVEINLEGRRKKFYRLINLQFLIMVIPLIFINFYLEKILAFWLSNNVNSKEILSFLLPLSISTLSISLFNSIKILFIAENKISLMKKPLLIIFFFFIFLTVMIYLQIINAEIYLYCWSISMFFLTLYFYFLFFTKNIDIKK